MSEVVNVRVTGRSTVRIVNEARALLEEHLYMKLTDDDLKEQVSNSIDELCDLAKALHHKYPIMKLED